jgi:hypothetical protein
MAYPSAEARQELVDPFADAIEQIGFALADLGAAYDQLDEHNAARLEAELFRPVQLAYGGSSCVRDSAASVNADGWLAPKPVPYRKSRIATVRVPRRPRFRFLHLARLRA